MTERSDDIIKKHLKRHMPELTDIATANVYILGKRLGGAPTGHVLAKFATDAWIQQRAPVFVMEGSTLSWDVVDAMHEEIYKHNKKFKLKQRFGMYFINTDTDTKRKLRETLDSVSTIWFVSRK